MSLVQVDSHRNMRSQSPSCYVTGKINRSLSRLRLSVANGSLHVMYSTEQNNYLILAVLILELRPTDNGFNYEDIFNMLIASVHCS